MGGRGRRRGGHGRPILPHPHAARANDCRLPVSLRRRVHGPDLLSYLSRFSCVAHTRIIGSQRSAVGPGNGHLQCWIALPDDEGDLGESGFDLDLVRCLSLRCLHAFIHHHVTIHASAQPQHDVMVDGQQLIILAGRVEASGWCGGRHILPQRCPEAGDAGVGIGGRAFQEHDGE